MSTALCDLCYSGFTENQIKQLKIISPTTNRVGLVLPISSEADIPNSLTELYNSCDPEDVTVIQDMNFISGMDGISFISNSDKSKIKTFAINLANILLDNLKLIAENPDTLSKNKILDHKKLLIDTYRPFEKWDLVCSRFEMDNHADVTVSAELYGQITGDVIFDDLVLDPIKELNTIFEDHISKIPISYFGQWMNGDENISNIFVNKDGEDVKLFDPKPPQHADWLVMLVKVNFSSKLFGALSFMNQISMDTLNSVTYLDNFRAFWNHF